VRADVPPNDRDDSLGIDQAARSRFRTNAAADDRSIILVQGWDPLGPDNGPEISDDEYDAYLGPTYRLIALGASEHDIAEHLAFSI